MRRSSIVLVGLAALGCTAKVEDPSKLGKPTSNIVLAQVDDIVLTATDLKEVVARYANQPFVVARYSTAEKKKELLESLIRYHVFAIEARKRGYDRDPEVLRVAKDKMVKLFTQHEINDKIRPSDIPDAEVERYYKQHAGEYVRPETVRVSQIVVSDRGTANQVAAQAQALPKHDPKGFRDLVARYSEDPDTKARGGDLMHIGRTPAKDTPVPATVVDAAFALKELGDVSQPVPVGGRWVILKLTDRRVALSRSLDDAKAEIQRRLADELRNKKKNDLVDQARKTTKIEVFEDRLASLDLNALLAESGDAAQTGNVAARMTLDASAVVGTKP